MEHTVSPTVAFDLAGARITIPEATIVELWHSRARLPQFQRSTESAVDSTTTRIGEAASDGAIYMGIVRGQDGKPDYRLYDLGEASERMPWAAATKWAEERGGSLPTRREQSVMFGNRGEGQYKAEWYWSCEQYAGGESYAWVQYFYDGFQYYAHKSDDYRARAVRREAIQ